MDSDANNNVAARNVLGRRAFMGILAASGVASVLAQQRLWAQAEQGGEVTSAMVREAAWLSGIEMNDEQAEALAHQLTSTLAALDRLRENPIDVDTPPALVFRPDFFYAQAGTQVGEVDRDYRVAWTHRPVGSPESDEQIALADIATQAAWLANRELSSVELTELYLRRLDRYDPILHAVVTLLPELAIEQAIASDRRRARQQTWGVLDGIPWVAKDLIAVPPYKTTWGAAPFRDQVRKSEATVSRRLTEAGSVLLAKVSLGALAWGDQWFGGMTRNPWNPQQGSSGSSAGSAACVAAGLASFAIGSETLGSIVSPCRRCRTSGLRPTFGRVSRAGCMPLAWSMDKIGPIARHVDDLALVFSVIQGPDGRDPTLVQAGFVWPRREPLRSLRIGVPEDAALNAMEREVIEILKSSGARIETVDLRTDMPLSALQTILGIEAATVFDDAFRTDPTADYGKWPSTFREAQFLPAVSYLRTNRLRGQLIVETERRLRNVDVVIGGADLVLTNLTGHPSLVVSCGSESLADGRTVPGVVKLTAAAYRESMLLHVGAAIQRLLPPRPAGPDLENELEKLNQDSSQRPS